MKVGNTYSKHDHRKGINISNLSIIPIWDAPVLCTENLRCHPSGVGRGRPGRSLVAQDDFKAILGDTGGPIAIHKNVALRGCKSLISGRENRNSRRSSSREPDYADAGRPVRERHPITIINSRQGSFKRLTAVRKAPHTKRSLSASGCSRKYSDKLPLDIQGYTRENGGESESNPRKATTFGYRSRFHMTALVHSLWVNPNRQLCR